LSTFKDAMSPTTTPPLPGSPELEALLARIAEDAPERERDRIPPHEQVRLLADAGFGTLRVPAELGGAGAGVREFFATLIALGQADSNLAQILRAHFGYVEQALVVADPDQRRRLLEPVLAGEIIGNAISESSGAHAGDFAGVSTTITPDGEGWIVRGTKYYSTGTLYSQRVQVWGVTPDGVPASALVPTDREGVTVEDDWDGFGQQLTGTGTTRFDGVRVSADEVIVLDAQPDAPRVPIGAFLQLYLTAIIAGNLRSVRDAAVALVRRRTRSFTHATTALPREDPVLQQVIGELASNAWAAEAIVLRAADAIAGPDAHDASRRVAEAKVVVDRLGLRSATLLFEVGGASATKADVNLDRHWRNIRTLASHNPTAYKSRALGELLVNGATLPDNTYF
jgi:alkylation response protein AidB-like acyl-CoA dehydrogenase